MDRDYAFQTEGSAFLLGRNAAALGDEPGLGKSLQAIRAAEARGARSILILCPAIARVSWQRELKRWNPTLSGRPGAAKMVLNCTSANSATDAISLHLANNDPLAVIVSYDLLATPGSGPLVAEILRRHRWDVLILDEAHALKNPAAKRTATVYGTPAYPGENTYSPDGSIVAKANATWILSGTLMPNHAGELYSHIRALFPSVLDELFGRQDVSQLEFEDRFCIVRDTVYGRQIAGTRRSEIPALRAALKPYILRRQKKDVLKDLPPIRWTDEPLDLNSKERGWAVGLDAAVRANVVLDPDDDDFIAELKDRAVQLSTARRELGLAKVFPAASWTLDQLDNGVQKIVLFAHHKEVISELWRHLHHYGAVIVDGSTPHTERAKAVDAFQTDPSVRVFIGQIQAAGTAITLTAASDLAFVECAWTPGDNYQAACRIHRIGQMSGAHVRFLYAPGTLDESIMRIFRRKAEEISMMFD